MWLRPGHLEMVSHPDGHLQPLWDQAIELYGEIVPPAGLVRLVGGESRVK